MITVIERADIGIGGKIFRYNKLRPVIRVIWQRTHKMKKKIKTTKGNEKKNSIMKDIGFPVNFF